MNDLSCLLAIRKKYANSYRKDSKYTSDVDISITGGSLGCAVSRGGSREGGSVGGAGRFIATFSTDFFLHHLKYFLSTYSYSFLCLCELPQHVFVFCNFLRCFVHAYFKVQEKKVKKIWILFLNILFLT